MLPQEKTTSILEALRKPDLPSAKAMIDALAPAAKTERERGALAALEGIYSSTSKAKDWGMHTWDAAKMERGAQSVVRSQMTDDFDRGYGETLLAYSRMLKPTESAQ